jgi:surface protein
MSYKKGIISVVSLIFIILVLVLAYYGFQNWIIQTESQIIADGEDRFNTYASANNFEIDDVLGDRLYINNKNEEPIYLDDIKIDGISCNLNVSLNSGLSFVSLSSCSNVGLQNSFHNILILSENFILEDEIYVKSFDRFLASCTLDSITREHGDSYSFFNSSSGFSCFSSSRTCDNGTFLGDITYNYSTCNIIVPAIPVSFISLWNTSKMSLGSSNSNQIALPLESSGSYNFTIDWGDGNTDTITTWNQSEVTHTYASEGEYIINITGEIRGFRFNNFGDRNKILDVMQWGDLNFGNNGAYFRGANYFNSSATDSPDLSGTTSFSSFFEYAFNFNGNISNWDTKEVTSMDRTFFLATSFNQDLSSWNTSSVNNMEEMFLGADSFNQDLSSWNVDQVLSCGIFDGNTPAWILPKPNFTSCIP